MKNFLKKIKEYVNAFIDATGKKTLMTVSFFIGIIFTLLLQMI